MRISRAERASLEAGGGGGGTGTVVGVGSQLFPEVLMGRGGSICTQQIRENSFKTLCLGLFCLKIKPGSEICL